MTRAEQQFVVGDEALLQGLHHACGSAVGLGEVAFEGGANQVLARVAGEPDHLLVDVGDTQVGRDRQHRVD